MARLIDADALYRDIKKNVGAYYPEHEDIKDECLCAVNEAPTVDAVEVCRCRECKHWTEIGTEFLIAKIYGECRLLGDDDVRYADDYCSDGERRENEQTRENA